MGELLKVLHDNGMPVGYALGLVGALTILTSLPRFARSILGLQNEFFRHRRIKSADELISGCDGDNELKELLLEYKYQESFFAISGILVGRSERKIIHSWVMDAGVSMAAVRGAMPYVAWEDENFQPRVSAFEKWRVGLFSFCVLALIVLTLIAWHSDSVAGKAVQLNELVKAALSELALIVIAVVQLRPLGAATYVIAALKRAGVYKQKAVKEKTGFRLGWNRKRIGQEENPDAK